MAPTACAAVVAAPTSISTPPRAPVAANRFHSSASVGAEPVVTAGPTAAPAAAAAAAAALAAAELPPSALPHSVALPAAACVPSRASVMHLGDRPATQDPLTPDAERSPSGALASGGTTDWSVHTWLG